MPKKKTQIKRRRSTKSIRSTKAKRKKSRPAKPTLKERLARAKKLETLDAGKPTSKISRLTLTSHPFRNDDFPQTYIQQISVSLDDPDHSLTLTWTGPNADSQETGPFRTSPGAGLRGLNCDDESTSRRSGSKCTPKGIYPVQGFQRRLIAIPALHMLHGLCNAEVSHCIISRSCPNMPLPMVVCALSQEMWRASSKKLTCG